MVSVNPTIGTEHGSNRNDGTKEDLAGDFSFTLNLPQTTPKYHKNEVIFKDANDIKLAKDIVVTFVNCTNEEPTLEEWKVRAGVDELTEGVAHPVSTIAWHKDQGGRTFFSADFGSAGRWMINNLAVDKYDPNRSDGSTIGPRDILERRYSSGTGAEVAYDPSYVYATDYQAITIADIDDDAVFQSNQRYGYMYNWTAISKNRDVIFDVNTPDPVTGDTGHRYMNLPSEIGTDQPKVQGICPYGWHIPSDKEWTILENEIIHNTSLYSSTADIDPSNAERFDPNNTETDREALTHGLPMKDMCQPYGDFLASQPEGTRFKPTQGTSNTMSPTTRAGFNLLLPGVASTQAGGTISFFGWMANYWTSSIVSKGQTMARLMQYTTDVMTRGTQAKSTLLPVRCKKDE